jgi:hypothetical protein
MFENEKVEISLQRYDQYKEAFEKMESFKAKDQEKFDEGYTKGLNEMAINMSGLTKFIEFVLKDVDINQIIKKSVDEGKLSRNGNINKKDIQSHVDVSFDFTAIRALFEQKYDSLTLDITDGFKITRKDG